MDQKALYKIKIELLKMNNEITFSKTYYLNELELKEKRLSLSNFLNYYNIDIILNNNLINIDLENFEYEYIHYFDLNQILEFIQNTNIDNNFNDYFDLINFDFDNLTLELLKESINYGYFDLDNFHKEFIYELNYYFGIEYFQYYIIKPNDINLIKEFLNYDILYNPNLDLYLLCIDHYGISFDYVLTQKTFTDLYLTKNNKKVFFNGIQNYSKF